MAELLTNNPEAMMSFTGRTPEAPCGYFRLSPCTYNNFNDWFSTLSGRYAILVRNFDKIKRDAERKNETITGDETNLGYTITDIKDQISELKKTPPGLTRDQYSKLINDVQRLLVETNSALESAQDFLDTRGVPFITTGIESRPSKPWSTGDILITVALVGAAGVGVWWLAGYVKGSRKRSLAAAAPLYSAPKSP